MIFGFVFGTTPLLSESWAVRNRAAVLRAQAEHRTRSHTGGLHCLVSLSTDLCREVGGQSTMLRWDLILSADDRANLATGNGCVSRQRVWQITIVIVE